MSFRKALVLSKGLHEPWNLGEAVLSRNFTLLLSEIYNELYVISTIDVKRGNDLRAFTPSNSKVRFMKYYYNYNKAVIEELKKVIGSEKIDIHVLNASLIDVLKSGIINYARRIWLYKFSLGRYDIADLKTGLVKDYITLLLSDLNFINIITTSLVGYIKYSKFSRNVYFIPVPIYVPYSIVEYYNVLGRNRNSNYDLTLTYIGHGVYERFPFIPILKVISKLRKEGYTVHLNTYISTWRHVNYADFVKLFKKAIDKYNLGTCVEIYVTNLTDEEKLKVLFNSDVFLFPSLTQGVIDPPLSVLEAMFSGCIVVATPVQSLQLILDRRRGFLISQKKIGSDLYDVLSRIVKQPKLIKEYRDKSMRYAVSFHSPNIVLKKLHGIIKGKG